MQTNPDRGAKSEDAPREASKKGKMGELGSGLRGARCMKTENYDIASWRDCGLLE